jgi:hypothetical protein
MSKKISSILVFLLLNSIAQGQTKTATSEASLSVLPDCTISATDLDLGVYNYRTGASGIAMVRVNCNIKNVSVLMLNNDNFQSYTSANLFRTRGVVFGRTLSSGSDQLPYSVEISTSGTGINRGFNVLFGGIVNGQVFNLGFINTAFQDTDLLLKAKVAPGIWKPSGIYQDLIQIELEFTP